MYGGLLMAAYGLAVITRSETRLAMAVLLWVVLEKKVCSSSGKQSELAFRCTALTVYCFHYPQCIQCDCLPSARFALGRLTCLFFTNSQLLFYPGHMVTPWS
jgi:hypothetical protein